MDLFHTLVSLCLGLWRISKLDPLSEVLDVPFMYHKEFAPDGPFKLLGAKVASEARHKRVKK